MTPVANWDDYLNFTEWEMRCRGKEKNRPCECDSASLMDSEFMEQLQALRFSIGRKLIVSSGYRCPLYNSYISKTGMSGPHTSGKAADIKIYGAAALSLLEWALGEEFDFTGIGDKQHGPRGKRFVHLDILQDHETSGPRPWKWTYE